MENEKEFRINQWASSKYKNKSKLGDKKYKIINSIGAEKYLSGAKTYVNNGVSQLFNSQQITTNLLPRNERIYHSVERNRNTIKKQGLLKHRILRAEKHEKHRLVSLDIKDSDQCISPQSSHSSEDDPQTSTNNWDSSEILYNSRNHTECQS